MFAFLKQRRVFRDARTKIGIDLHRQIRDALASDHLGTEERLSSTFTVGYVLSFVRDSFSNLGARSPKAIDSDIHYICDGVIPRKLYKIYSDQGAALRLAGGMEDQDKMIANTGLSPAGVTQMFELGCQAGSCDAQLVSLQATPADNLRRFLLSEALNL